jgi:hypothetical protein
MSATYGTATSPHSSVSHRTALSSASASGAGDIGTSAAPGWDNSAPFRQPHLEGEEDSAGVFIANVTNIWQTAKLLFASASFCTVMMLPAPFQLFLAMFVVPIVVMIYIFQTTRNFISFCYHRFNCWWFGEDYWIATSKGVRFIRFSGLSIFSS